MISGTPRTLEVLEIDSALLQFNAEGVIWPEELPSCEGIMVWCGILLSSRDFNSLPGLQL